MKRSRRVRRNPLGMIRGRTDRSSPRLPKWVWIAFGLALVGLVAVIVRMTQRHDALLTWQRSLEADTPAFSWPAWNDSWPSPPPPPRNAIAGDLRGPYAFAALNADRLRFIPCYCGCATEGHTSALACFVKGFTPRGAPMWSDHAFTCPLCVSILREVSLMTSRGMSLPAIREAIDEHHGGMLVSPTSTPLPQ